jgi:hypothetical protein
MQVRMVIFPGEDGLDVLICGKGEKAPCATVISTAVPA